MSDDRTNIRLSPRVRLRAIDSATGSYPSTARVGDPDFRGDFPVGYDDTNTVIFSENVQVNLPTTLGVGSQYLTDYVTSSISTTGTVRKGIADELVHFTPGESLTPFNESRHPELTIRSVSAFHETGSRIQDVGIGFESPIRSKTKLEIDLTPSRTTTFGPNYTVGTREYPMVYYNFDTKSWEPTGHGFDVDASFSAYFGSNSAFDTEWNKASVGFSPSQAYTSLVVDAAGNDAGQSPDYFKGIGRPMSNFGFPMHQKFHATSSQLFDMSTLIDRPFLLEKIVYEFSGTYYEQGGEIYGRKLQLPYTVSYRDQRSATATFFILNQRRPFSHVDEIKSDFIYWTHDDPVGYTSASIQIPGKYQLTDQTDAPFVYVDTGRDLVTYNQVTFFRSGTDAEEADVSMKQLLDNGLGRDLNVNYSDFRPNYGDVGPYVSWSPWYDPTIACFITKEFILSGSVKQTPKLNKMGAFNYRIYGPSGSVSNGGVIGNVRWDPGGRNIAEMVATGRDFVGSAPGDTLSTTVARQHRPLSSGNPFRFNPGTNVEQNSPYLLLPSDKLVFGWEAPMSTVARSSGGYMYLYEGKGRLVFYGSFIAEGKEFHDSRNPPLTSLAIHEDIHWDNPVLDQFDTEPRMQFSGTYIGDFVTGSLFTGSFREVASNTFETAYIRPSDHIVPAPQIDYARPRGFMRGVKLSTNNERYFDTVLPRADDISRLNGATIDWSPPTGTPPFTTVSLRIGDDGGALDGTDLISDKQWLRAFPFEPKYSTVPRILKSDVALAADRLTATPSDLTPNTGVPVLTIYSTNDINPSIRSNFIHGRYDIKSLGAYTDIKFSSLAKQSYNDEFVRGYFGIGDNESGSVRFATGYAGVRQGTILRGFKYGIKNIIPEFSSAVFRYDKYGQFRDMLEQRYDAKYFDILGIKPDGTPGNVGARTGPVQVRFVKRSTDRITDPYTTFSSNVSVEATSSLPYFDGFDRNRSVPPDLDENVDVVIEPNITITDIINRVVPMIELPTTIRRVIEPIIRPQRATTRLTLPPQLSVPLPRISSFQPIATSGIRVAATATTRRVSKASIVRSLGKGTQNSGGW